MIQKQKILLDVDGVLLDYNKAFENFFNLDGGPPASNESLLFSDKFNIPETEIVKMVEQFNSHREFANIPPVPKSVKAIDDISRSGHEIIIISSCGESEITHEMRKENLINVFGNVFSEFHLIKCHGSKHDYLSKYWNDKAFWIDDTYHHYINGKEMGFHSIWKTTDENKFFQSKNEHRNENIHDCWNEIQNIILKNK